MCCGRRREVVVASGRARKRDPGGEESRTERVAVASRRHEPSRGVATVPPPLGRRGSFQVLETGATLDLDGIYTTQDTAVAIAFLVTEIVEFAMLNAPNEPVEISLRRTSELTARLALASKVLSSETEGSPERAQFERIVTGLAKQLRSAIERKLGRYSVEFPVFPAN